MGGPIPKMDDRVPIIKAQVAEAKIPDAMSCLAPDEKDTFSIDGVLGPAVVPFPLPPQFKDPEVFVHVWKRSAALQPPIEAYATDIDGMGHRFEPAFDPNGKNALEDLREAYENHRAWQQLYSGKDESTLPAVPTENELKDHLVQLKRDARQQKMRADYFFKAAVRESSFNRLRRNTRQQCETGGNWYWEIIRKNGVPIRIKHPPFQSMRALKEDKHATEVTSKILVTPVHWVELTEHRKFRRYVQKTVHGSVTYFKEYGDPRQMCACCGTYYPTAENSNQARNLAINAGHRAKDFKPATEILHDGALHVPGSPYFLPRWIGALDFVLGEGAAAEMNLAYFNNPMPAGMILCSGGKFADDLKTQLETFLQQMVVGSKGFHKILTVSAVAENPDILSKGAPPVVNLQWIPLMKDRPKDALFLKWIQLCEEKVGRQFRLNVLLYGGSEKLNKATAWAILKFAEERVYQPLRADFDDLINRTIMPAIGVTLWKFRTNAPETRDPATQVKIYDVLQAGPSLSIDELRALAADITNREYEPFDEDWSQFPWKMLEHANDDKEKIDIGETADADGQGESGADESFGEHTEPPKSDEGEEDQN